MPISSGNPVQPDMALLDVAQTVVDLAVQQMSFEGRGEGQHADRCHSAGIIRSSSAPSASAALRQGPHTYTPSPKSYALLDAATRYASTRAAGGPPARRV